MIKKIIGWIVNIILLLLIMLVFFSGYSMLEAKKHPGKIPSVMGYTNMSVLSGSMGPVLQPGDMIITKAAKPEAVKKGDIITFKVGGNTLVTHRVVEIVQQKGQISFRTKGDANNVEDSNLVTNDQLVGTLAFRIPFGGYVSRFARSPVGFIILIVLPIGLIIANELKTILSQWGKEEEKEKPIEDRVEI